jgi:spore germination protein YaaH
VKAAHEHGARVVPVIVCHDSATIHEVVTTSRQAAVSHIVTAVTTRDADGVNLDFEGVAAADRGSLIEFTAALSEALRAEVPEAYLSVAVPAIDWSNAWDYESLVEIADRLVLMGYDYHWRTSDPGPIAPLAAGAIWDFRTVTWSVDDVLTKTGARGDRILLGVPLYGYDYPAVGPEIPGQAVGEAAAIFQREAEEVALTVGRRWDTASQTPYYLYQRDAVWHQVWYEDAGSLEPKLDLVVDRGLRGVALWALNYQAPSLWQVLEAARPEPDPDPRSSEEGGCRVGGRAGERTWGVGLVGLGMLVTAARRRRSRRGSFGSARPAW